MEKVVVLAVSLRPPGCSGRCPEELISMRTTDGSRRWIGLVALLVVMLLVGAASGATAAKMITGKQIKNNSVTSADIRNNTLRSRDIRNGTINRADLAGAVSGSLIGGRIPSGVTVTGAAVFDLQSDSSGDYRFSVNLPGKAGKTLTSTDVNFANDASSRTVDDDPSCTGTQQNPTAPPGKVCLYYVGSASDTSDLQGIAAEAADSSFSVFWVDGAGNADVYAVATWAYTAP